MKRRLLSVIIPTYNSAERLRNALNSVSLQTVKDLEVIVCDDGSTDNTGSVVADFKNILDIKYIFNKNWGGPARPRNNGLRAACGEYIAFLDSDDIWYDNKIEVLSKYLGKGDVFYHDLDICTPKGLKLIQKVKGRHLTKPVFMDLMKNMNALITSSVVVRKSVIDQAGGFTEYIGDLTLDCFEDFDLWLRLARLTEKFIYIPLSLGRYWIGGGSVSQASERLIRRMDAVYEKHESYLDEKGRFQADTMKYYLIARTRQKIGSTDKALEAFAISARSSNFKIKMRSIVWLILLRVRKVASLMSRTG
jgi:Glycosyltransferases involved in cell wall biogenesis